MEPVTFPFLLCFHSFSAAGTFSLLSRFKVLHYFLKRNFENWFEIVSDSGYVAEAHYLEGEPSYPRNNFVKLLDFGFGKLASSAKLDCSFDEKLLWTSSCLETAPQREHQLGFCL